MTIAIAMIEDRIPIRINVVIMNFENPNRANIIDIGSVVTIIAIIIEMMIVIFSRNDLILVFMIFLFHFCYMHIINVIRNSGS